MAGVSVLLFGRAPDGAEAVRDAYHHISQELAGTPGLTRNALLELVDGSGRFVVLSEWASMDAFRAWEEGPEHRDTTAPLRPFHDRAMGGGFGIYRIAAEYVG